MSKTARILIAGAGVGGLALAQALHHGGLEVAVHEQDPTPRIRHQGFRIHIDENGDRALRSCLPAATFELVRQSSGTNDDVVGMYTEQLDPVLTQTFPGITDELITNVDRNTLRHGLLTGLGDIVHFGHEVRGYRHTDSGRVRVEFADGTADEADLLIGADGVGSAVRRQLLPHAGVRDLGVRCLYGRMTLTEVTRALIPPAVERGFSWVSDNAGCGAGFAPVRFRRPPAGASDYLMITLLATPEHLGVSHERLAELSARQLWTLAVQATAAWHPALRELFAHADADSFFPIALRAGQRVGPWTPGPVTLLGDAIHTMPPTGGVGANTALRDAQTLAGELLAAARGRQSLIAAVGAYEAVMLPRGFATIDASLEMAAQLFGSSV
ncbi:FAD-dependent oxidoreductase [Nocardia sp. NBC_01327]|uniref:FAD-dependent oxidoreductase n=1 Tax=Nocardia sp. NBC_01327 TaxID=2903593 RepID=UPI002E125443|nr:FAD-dependent monooxygenase [Nocardia sp. NBC_01327]